MNRPRFISLAGRIALAALLLTAAPAVAPAALTLPAAGRGVVGDGATLNTAAIQKLIDEASAQGGGTVAFAAGRYLTGTIQLKDGVTLRLEAGAVLLGSTRAADYRNLDPFTAGDGIPLGYALIVADGAKNVGIEGAGTIDGQGRELRAAQSPFTVRPFLMRWLRCANVTVKDVHLTNPGAWTLNFFQSRGITVERVTIRTRATGLANNDGIDLDSCDGAVIRDCDIDSGDDALCFKATSPLPSRNITVANCRLSTKCNAIKLGTESLGGFENITVTGCTLANIGMAGIAIYEVDGGDLRHVTVSDIAMDGVAVPISVRLGARLKVFRAGDQPKPVGTLRDVTIRNVRATGTRLIGLLINGLPGHPVENLALENIAIALPGGGTAEQAQIQLAEKENAYPEFSMFGRVLPASGFYLRHARGVTLKDVRTTPAVADARPERIFIDVAEVTPVLSAVTGVTPQSDSKPAETGR